MSQKVQGGGKNIQEKDALFFHQLVIQMKEVAKLINFQ